MVQGGRSEQVLARHSSEGWVFNSGAGHPVFQRIDEELDDTRLLPRALRADSVVRSGILPSQSSLRWDDGVLRGSLCLQS